MIARLRDEAGSTSWHMLAGRANSSRQLHRVNGILL